MNSPAATATGLGRWLAPLLEDLPALVVVDAHTHIGSDCDGMVCEPAQLTGALDVLGARAVCFPLHVEGGYSGDNDAVIAAAASSSDQLVPFCRLDPHDAPGVEGARAIAAGARGIKLHPRAERFTLAHPGVEEAFALAHEHSLPVLIHAGRGIEPLGADALRPRSRLSARDGDPRARSDHRPGLDDRRAGGPPQHPVRHGVVEPGRPDRIVRAGGAPADSVRQRHALRRAGPQCSDYAALRALRRPRRGSDPQRDGGAGGAPARWRGAGRPGPRPGRRGAGTRAPAGARHDLSGGGLGRRDGGRDGQEPLELARMALAVAPSHPRREHCEAAIEALDMPPSGPLGLTGVAIAGAIAATPNVPV